MAKFQITGPDGAKYEVEAPDDASEQQIIDYVQKNAGAPAAAAAPPDRPGALERGARGVWQGLQDVPDAMNQLMSRGAAAVGIPGGDAAVKYWDADIKQRNADYKRDVRGGQDDFDFGRFGGNLAFTAPISAAMPVGGGVLKAVGAGALGGGLSGGMQPVTEGDFLTEKAKQVAFGAGGGGIAGGAANLLGRAISPNVSPEVAKLRAEGVTPTPGQIMGGAFKSAEEKLASAPIVGQAIKSGQTRAVEQLNVAAINRALAPLNQKLPKGMIGSEAISHVDDVLSKSYDDVLGRIGPTKPDGALANEITGALGNLANMKDDTAAQFKKIVQNELGQRALKNGGALDGEAIKAAESNLGQMVRRIRSTPASSADDLALAEAIEDTQQAVRSWLERTNPAQAKDLKAVNTGYANYLRSVRAASSVAAEDGVFSPAQLHNAVKGMDKSRHHKAFAKGDALMQDLSSAGKSVLGNKVPNSGTADRLGALAALNPGTWPYIAAGIPASLLYTGPGQALSAGLLAGRQGPVAGLLGGAAQRLGLPAGMALTPALQGLLSQ